MNSQHEVIYTEPLKYKDSTEADLGFGENVTFSEMQEYRSPDGQYVGVWATQPKYLGPISAHEGESDATQPERVIIAPASHEYRLEPSWMDRLQQLATEYNARVVAVEMPGTVGLMGADKDGQPYVHTSLARLDGDRQTPSQLIGAARGNFLNHANTQLDAIASTFGLDEDAKYTLFGESMGAAVATDILGLMKKRELKVDELILFEAVNAFKGRRLQLPLKLAGLLSGPENDRRNTYIAENDAIGHSSTAFELSGSTEEERRHNKALDNARKSPLKQQGLAGIVNGIGMATGRLESLNGSLDLFSSSEMPRVTMVRGRESLVSREADYSQFIEAILGRVAVRSITIADYEEQVDIGHSHLFSLGRGVDVYEGLNK